MLPILVRRALGQKPLGSPSIGAQPVTRTPSKDDLRAIAVAALHRLGQAHLRTLPAIEYMEDADLRALGTAGTVLAPVVLALNAAGAQTASTVGAVMDTMGLTREQLHEGLCHCRYGDNIAATQAAQNFAAFA